MKEGHLRIVPITPSGEEPDLSALLAACEAKILELGVELQARDAELSTTRSLLQGTVEAVPLSLGQTVGLAIMNYLLGVGMGVLALWLAGWRKV